jgi:hypothetical protein
LRGGHDHFLKNRGNRPRSSAASRVRPS